MSDIPKLHAFGQSIWYDNIQRKLLENGYLAKLIADGDIRGVTSNPSIFNNAIAKSSDYDAALVPLAKKGLSPEEIFFELAVEDIRAASDLFKDLYADSEALDGYVSLEVSPYLAHDEQGTVAEAIRLWKWIDRPNICIKIPATKEGIGAIRSAIAEGINVNVTLIFSLDRYLDVTEAYICGLEDRVSRGLPVDRIASVASFFVSRADSNIDAKLDEIIAKGGPLTEKAEALKGKAAIANARMAYSLFKDRFFTDRFEKLQKLGARVQRPLWASTSTKNPDYRDVIYVEELIGPYTVNTMPPQTLDAFRDHGKAELTVDVPKEESQSVLDDLESLGISLYQVTEQLEEEGVKSFSDAFTSLLNTIKERSIKA
jgi:transaldolase